MSLRARLNFGPEPVYLMDGSAFIFRGFYAFQNMSRSDGFPTNALYIVARIILKLLREEQPRYFSFVMDGKGKNFRHEKFSAYKAQRTAMPEPLAAQIEPIRRLLNLLGLNIVVSDSCEADDCIASLAMRLREERPVVMVGSDKDLKQCLHPNVVLWDPASKEEKITTLASFREENGFEPDSWPDYQALVGDSSDNIPGVPKIGPKSAQELIRAHPHLEDLFSRLPSVPPKMRAKLEGQEENAMLYRELTTLRTDTCQAASLEDLAVRESDRRELLAFLGEYELRSLAREVESMDRIGFFNRRPLAGVPEGSLPPAEARRATRNSQPAEPETGLQADQSPIQPVDAHEERIPVHAGQGTLFGLEAEVADPLPEAACPSILPLDRPNTLLVLIPEPEKGLVIAGRYDDATWEYLYTGPVAVLVEDLCRTARQAGSNPVCIAPDSKSLIKSHPDLLALPWKNWFDLSVAAYLLGPEDRGYAWRQVAVRWMEQTRGRYTPENHPGLLALDLYEVFCSRLSGASLTGVFKDLEMPLVPVLARMEERGILLDLDAFAAFLKEVEAELERLTAEIYDLAGRPFNIRSSLQLGDVLFTVLELPRSGKTRGGAASTSQDALEKLASRHPIVRTILDYRKLEKLRSTYLDPMPRLVDCDGRIHTTFNQTATATGRLSSSNPNLQNIPIRGAFGGRMRSCFIAPQGKLLVCADYSQIELRVLAHLSGDPTLLDAFHKNEDIHSRTAGLLFEVDLENVLPEQRRSAKTINFGLVYGMGAQRLAQELRISLKEAKEFIERYFSRLGRLKEFYDSIEKDACNFGYVQTMAGRRRFTPDILSQNNQLRSQARRQAINTRIQGSAADIIKLAMVAVENDPVLERLQARLLLQIHDELLLEVPEKNACEAGTRLAELMSSVKPGGETMSVPLLVEWGSGKNWDQAH